MAGSVIGVGSALVDQLAYVPESFVATISGDKGGMELVDHVQMQAIVERLPGGSVCVPGGSAANTAVGVAQLGAPAGLLAMVGTDLDGDFYVSAAEKAGLSTNGFKRTPDLPTGKCLAMITPDSERTMRTYLGASGALQPGDVSVSDFAGYRFVHVEGYLLFNPDLIGRILECARDAGAVIGLDLAAPEVVRSSGKLLRELVETYVDIVYGNEEEAAAYTGCSDPDAAVEALSEHTDIAVVKLGSKGARIRKAGTTTHVDACKVGAVDTTGAGDFWAAGFLYGLGQGMDIEVAARVGALVSAEVVQVTGAALPDPVWARLRLEIESLQSKFK